MFKLNRIVRLSVTMVLVSFMCLFAFPVNASSIDDINIASAVKLQKFLLTADTLTSEEAQLFDMNHDDKINACDLTLMKRYLLYSKVNNKTQDIINQALARVSPTDLEENYPYSEDLYEVKDCYLTFDSMGGYTYTFLTEEPTDAASVIADLSLIKGLHIYKYFGEQEPVSLKDSLPDTSERTFSFDKGSSGNVKYYNYSLKDYSLLTNTDIVSIAKVLSRESVNTPEYVSLYDYNLNGNIDYEDLDTIILHITCNPSKFFPNLNPEMLDRFLQNLMFCRKTTNFAMLLTDSTAPIEFALNIPTGDISGSTRQSYFFPVQILPASYYQKVKSFATWSESYNDSEMDCIAWHNLGLKIFMVQLEDSKYWKFESGAYAYVLNDDGTYCKEWLFIS